MFFKGKYTSRLSYGKSDPYVLILFAVRLDATIYGEIIDLTDGTSHVWDLVQRYYSGDTELDAQRR